MRGLHMQDVLPGLSWETWVAVAEHTRKLIPVENRKQAKPALSKACCRGCVGKWALGRTTGDV